MNSEFHTGTITDISADTKGQYILTASDDKTARLWDANTGNALRIFRPPIGFGSEGCLNACALSPDGSVAVVGGNTGASWNKADSSMVTVGNWQGYAKHLKYSIYLFSTSSGDLLFNIGSLEAAITDIAFSPDGTHIAASLANGKGVILFKSADGSLERKLIGYGSSIEQIAFSQSGMLATVAADRYLRLYNSSYKLLSTTALDAQPASLAFSNNETQIAVGYEEQPYISLIDVATSKKTTLFTYSQMKMTLKALVFTKNGHLFAGGNFISHGKSFLSVWQKSQRTDMPAAKGNITSILSLPDGSIVYGTSYPEIGRILPDRKYPTEWQGSEDKAYIRTADIVPMTQQQRSRFQVNDDGSIVGLRGVGDKVLFFSLPERELNLSATTFPKPSDHSADNTVRITGWNKSPALNGSPLKILDKNETALCVDVSGDGTRILAGSTQYLYCMDGKGQVLWKRPLSDKCMAVKLTANKQIAIALLDDGTCTWFDMKEGVALLTLFVHPDNQRWALWTPAGFYDCAAGAEEIIGWNLNRGHDKASAFYPIAQFRQSFYHPETIDKATGIDRKTIATGNSPAEETKPVKTDEVKEQPAAPPVITQALPPEVHIVSPKAESSIKNKQVALKYYVATAGEEPVESVKILIDGRPVQLLSPVKKGINETAVDIPERDCEISVIAKNKYASSVQSKIKIKWTGASEDDFFKPKLYILAVGISKYQDKNLELLFAAKDANDFAKIMTKQKDLLYGDVQVKLLTDKNGSKTSILEGLEWIQRETTSKDVAMIFFAGHGINDNSGTFFYVPVDANLELMRTTCVNYVEIKQTVAAIAGKVVLFMDACHSGNVMGSTRRAVTDLKGVVNELASAENGAIVFTSSTGKQYSLENSEWNNGAFTKSLVEGLDGKADLFHKKQVSIKTLDAYITQRVKDLTKGQQAPTTIVPSSIPDFPIAVIK